MIVFLLIAVVYPTVNYRTWGNNELSYWNDGNPNGMVCDEKFWQPPSNCRPIESEPRDTIIPNESLMKSLPPCISDRTACFNQDTNLCDPSGWECVTTEGIFDVIVESNSSNEPVLHYSEFEGEIFVENHCTTDVSCYGFDDVLKIILDCSDMVMHGCGPIPFENHTEVENEN